MGLAVAAALPALAGTRVASAQQLAFPEAEGFGRFATGARTNVNSASVYHVTNLNDTGGGSFRDAVSQSNRFVVFDVGGIAKINSVVTFAGNITIAGQTAPGGFQVYGNRVAFHNANNLVSRYWGARNAASNDNDAASLARGENMIWDHMSISWGVDGTFDINPDSGATIDNLTIQNTIIAQGLQVQNHSTGGLMTLSQDRNFSVIKSLFADNKTRNPKARGNNEFLNNVTYGWTGDAYIMGDTVNETSRANVQGNYFMRGPLASSGPFTNGTAQFEIYGDDNIYDSNANGVIDGGLVVSYPGATVVPSRFNYPTTSVMSAADALPFVIENVGANIVRDVVDTNVINEVKSYGTLGGLINRETDVYPNYDTTAANLRPRARVVDTDGDGMPDNYESFRGFNPANNSDWKTITGTGYTRLEDYLNELGAYVNTRTAPAGGAWTTPATWGGAVPNFSTTAVATGGISHSSGNGFARRATLNGSSTISGGTLDVFDTLSVGGAGIASLSITGGTVTAGQIVLAAPGQIATMSLGSGATLQVGPLVSGGGTAAFSLNGGTIRATSANSLAISAPTTVAAAGGTIDTNGFNGSAGNLSGSGTLSKIGGGTLTLNGNNAGYSGEINLIAGGITLATAAANSSTGAITASGGTTVSVTTSGASTPLTLVGGASVTLTAGGLTYNGAVTGASNTTLVVSNSSTLTSNFSIGGSLTNFAGTMDLAASTGNIRIGSTGSSLANFDAGDATGTFRTTFDGTTNFGSLSGASGTRLQGSTNGTTSSTYVIGGNNTPTTTFAGTITDGTNTTPTPLHITKTGTGTLVLSNASSTYTGATKISGGVLSVATLATGGLPSSSGQSTNAAANLVLDGGTLRYTGGAGSTDHAFTLTANGGTIERTGTGTFDFTSSAAFAQSGAGDRTLMLAGTSTATTNLYAGIGDPSSGKTSLSKSGPGTWRLAGAAVRSYSGDTTVNGGTLALPAAGGTRVIRTGGLTIGAAAKLDLGDGKLITTSAPGSATSGVYDGVQGHVQRAANSGAWSGFGLTTTMPDAASGLTSIGVASGAQFRGLGPGDTDVFMGQTITAASTVAMYTYAGDANLDGAITGDDYSSIDFAILTPGASGWGNGDFNYDGQITGDDYSAIDFNLLAQGAPFPTSALVAGVTTVPEPGVMTWVMMLAPAIAALRRRRACR
jgi:autotransporter-associated beta strand protein